MKHGHVFVVFVPRVEHFETHAAIVLEAVGKMHGLDVILRVVLGAMLEGVAYGAEPGGGALALHATHVLVEGVQPGPFPQEKSQNKDRAKNK